MHSSAKRPLTGCQNPEFVAGAASQNASKSQSLCMVHQGQWVGLTRGPIRDAVTGLSASTVGDTGVRSFTENSLRTDPVWGAGCSKAPHTEQRCLSAPHWPPPIHASPQEGMIVNSLLSFIPCCAHHPGASQTCCAHKALRSWPQLGVQPTSPPLPSPLGETQVDPHTAWQREPVSRRPHCG